MDIAHDSLVVEPSDKAIWNPNAAANWSLVFTPAFGAYLHMQNWRTLGEPARAEASRRWFYAGIFLLGLYLWGAIFSEDVAIDVGGRIVAIVFLLAWYFVSAKPQAKYVAAKYGNTYEHKHWGKVLLYALGVLVGYFVLSALVVLIWRSIFGM